MSIAAYFSQSYAEARGKFLDAARNAGAKPFSYVNEAVRGPAGEILATDAAWLGPSDAPNVLVTLSATHGIEGFAGSAIQIGSLRCGFAGELPRDTALLLIHAVNPYGFAWLRRVVEGNIDLNRNFIRFDQPLPANPGYDELADALCPAEWTEQSRRAARKRLSEYGQRHGTPALLFAITAGQYAHPQGLFYGGSNPCWSRQTLLRIAAERFSGAKQVAVIDYHTGLGPYGKGERIVTHPPESPATARAKAWWGGIAQPRLGTSASADVVGDALNGLDQAFPGIVTAMALEYGVRPVDETLDALRADNWLHHHGVPGSEQGRAIKEQMRAAFSAEAEDWRESVFEQAIDAQRCALRGLAG